MVGFFKVKKAVPGISEGITRREEIEAAKAERAPEWAKAKTQLEKLKGPEGQHHAERQKLQEEFDRKMAALRKKQGDEYAALSQKVAELDPEEQARRAIVQENFERYSQVYGKRFCAFMRLLDEYLDSHEITEAECQRAYWKAMYCEPFVKIISAMENYRYEPVE